MPDQMGGGDIAFPGLGIYLENVPQGFHIFGFYVAFYGLIIGIGVVLAFLTISHLAKKYKQNPDDYYLLGCFLVLFGVLGARLYYVIFSWDYYKHHLSSIFNIRQGGLAIYGGIIAGLLVIIVWCKIKKRKIPRVGDIVVPGVLVGQILGRWGNFFNREVFGTYSDSFLAMRLPVEAVRAEDIDEAIRAHMEPGTNYIQVHPTFLYESLYNLVLFILIMIFHKKKKFNGEVMLWYFGGYGIGRFVIEGIRTDRLLIGHTNIAVSQLLGIVLFAAALIIDVVVRILMKKKGITKADEQELVTGAAEGTETVKATSEEV